jgi:hypothetical protein
MARVARRTGGKGAGGYPIAGRGAAIRIACPDCDAQVGERCRTYKVDRGERLYIQRYRTDYHQARRDAAKKGAA